MAKWNSSGSTNNPSKRWPVSHWRKLISLLIEEGKSLHINLYGSVKESLLANQIIDGFDKNIVLNFCGKTSLLELSKELASCDKVIGNDSGGMHLANAVGTATYVLFGPTNHKVTGPCFDAPLDVIRSSYSIKTNGINNDLGNLSALKVFQKVT